MCNYCSIYPNNDLFNNRDKLGKKSSGYPGIEVTIDPVRSTLYIGGCADVYEPSWIEAEFEINFCPMCGRDLREDRKE